MRSGSISAARTPGTAASGFRSGTRATSNTAATSPPSTRCTNPPAGSRTAFSASCVAVAGRYFPPVSGTSTAPAS
ncbi:hypothetical protein OV079_03365 [Nannocystis pusilla]|uniref:Uncharacterized protein n=1 Tax=Nannocystis pusilla TaxID=889268 RepID=A0A9X3EIA0_9BACT|nr:hypothetical protein [Nannocystis pusilla]MCY1004624.1 hypothetical protein [Nannocystis pusilla]